MTSELVPWRGHTVPVLNQQEISRYNVSDYIRMIQQGGYGLHAPIPVQTTYGRQAQEPIANNFQGFVEGLLYSDGPVAAVTAYRLRVFSQAPMLFRRKDGTRPGDYYDDPSLDQLRRPWAGGSLGDLMKLALIHSDFAGNAYIVRIEDELVCLRPDWVKIVLERRMYGGVQVGWRQMGIAYVENGNYADVDFGSPEIATFLPGEYAHFKSAFPDPLANYRGMSWLTPIVKEVMSDKAATQHKLKYFENAATPNLAVKTPAQLTPEQFRSFVSLMREQHDGVDNAYRTLYLGDGADVSVIGSNMQQMDFAAVQGKIETRIANGGGIHAVLIGFSEGMQGSSLNAGNYGAAKRNTTDTTIRDLWRNWCSSMQELFPPPDPADELSYDERDIPYLHEDQQDEAGVRQTDAATISSLITSGFEPDSVTAAVMANDWSLLKHTGLTSVQLLPPGAQDTDGDGSVDVTAEDGEAEDAYLAALEEFRSQLEAWDLEDVIIRTVVDGEDEDEIDRARYNIRRPEGVEGGGRFRKLSEVVFKALDDWMNGEGPDDPLTDVFTKDQLRLAAKQLGLVRDRERVSEGTLKKRLLDKATADVREQRDAPDGEKDVPEPRKAETPDVDRLFTSSDREQAERILSRLTQSEFEQGVADPSRSRKELVEASRLLGLPTSGTKDALRKRLVERAAELRKGGAGKPDAPKAADRRVLDALADAPKGRYVKLADLREQLDDVDRQDLDRALLQLARDGRIILTPEEDRRRIKKRERDAAVRFGDQEQHFVTLDPVTGPTRVNQPLLDAAPESPATVAQPPARKSSDVVGAERKTLGDDVAKRYNWGRETVEDIAASLAYNGDFSEADARRLVRELLRERGIDLQPAKAPAPESPAVAKVQAAKKATSAPAEPMTGEGLRDSMRRYLSALPKTSDRLSQQQSDHFAASIDGLAGVDPANPAALREAAARFRASAESMRGPSGMRLANNPRDSRMYKYGKHGMAVADQFENVADALDRMARAAGTSKPAKKATPRKATPRKPATPDPEGRGPDGLSSDPAVREVQVENRIRAAYRRPGRVNEWMSLADMRELVGDDVDRAEVDATLRRLIVQSGVRIIPESNQSALTDRHRRAEARIGGQRKHHISFGDPSPRPLPTPARKATPRVPKEPPADVAGRGSVSLPSTTSRIRDAYANAPKGDTGFVSLADIRDQLGDIPRAEQDAALRQLATTPGVELIPVANSKSIAPRFGNDPRVRDAAITVGGEEQHAIRFPSDEGRRSANLDEDDLFRSDLDEETEEDDLDEEEDDDLDERVAEAEEFEADLDVEEDDEAERSVDLDVLRAMDRNQLKHYWTKNPEGLAKWLPKRKQWTALYRHLRKHVGSERAKRMAAQWVHEVTGNWPGSDAHRVATGHRPRGNRIGPG